MYQVETTVRDCVLKALRCTLRRSERRLSTCSLFYFYFCPSIFCRKYSRIIIPGFKKEQKMGPQRDSKGTNKGKQESGLPIEVGRKKEESVPWIGEEWLV